ncbi:MAG: hypothetical protein IKU16_03815 [Muribaculaceae bacterium]|nr:hypothetical protein [Muribaculaceae bacterium]
MKSLILSCICVVLTLGLASCSPKQSATKQPVDAVSSTTTATDIEEKAKSVIRGEFGNGQERKKRLGSDYSEVQKKVNEIYSKGKSKSK